MIVYRSLFRVDLAWKFTNAFVIPKNLKPLEYYRGYCLYYSLSYNRKMDREKVIPTGMNLDKKHKSTSSVWRPICSQVNFTEDWAEPGDIDVGTSVNNPTVSAGMYTCSVEVGASLMRFIRGKGGSIQKEIEKEMGVKLIFPLSKGGESIMIEGISLESVNEASDKIQSVIDKAVNSPSLDYSHFVSLPLAVNPDLVDKLINFQNSVLGSSGAVSIDVPVDVKVDNNKEHAGTNMNDLPTMSHPPKESKSTSLSGLGIDKSIFIKPKTFHLTVLMLKLWNKERVDTATKVLKSVLPKVIEALDSRPLSVRLKGLSCLKGSFEKAQVLYAPVEEIGNENRLLRACQIIIDAYVKAGLVLKRDATRSLKLHATVMNVRHRKRDKWAEKLNFFDAHGIMEKYGSEEWGEYLIQEAHLSQRFAFDEKGYYQCCASIPFPQLN